MSKGAIRRANPDLIISHWYKLIDGVQASSLEFYTRLQQVLCDRRVPGLQCGRVEFREGGPLSAKRMFLRLKRERIVFEVCAAKFGTGYFISWRLGERLLRLNFLGLFALVAGSIAGGFALFDNYRNEIMTKPLPFIYIGGIALGLLVLMFWLARSAVALGLADLDALLLHVPVIAGFYERFLRPNTYYRIDLALMYEAAVHQAVLLVIDELTDAQQLPRLAEGDRKPILRDFYKR